MENNFLKKSIRKTSIISGLMLILIISIIILALFEAKGKIPSILGKPEEINTVEELEKYNKTGEGYATLNIEYMADSGYYIAEDGGKGTITENVYIAIIEDKFVTVALPAKVSSKNPSEMENVSFVVKRFDGLENASKVQLLSEIKKEIAEGFGVSIQDVNDGFIDVMLEDSKTDRLLEKIFYIGVFIGLIFLIMLVIKKVIAITNYRSSKVIKRLSKYGNTDYIENQINQEINYPEYVNRRITITNNWIIDKTPFSVKFMPIENLVWVYNVRTKHYQNGIRTGTSFSVMCYSDKNEKLPLNVGWKKDEEKAIEIIELLSQKAPWAIYGYSDEIKKNFKKNPQKVIEEVRNIKMENSL
ncbi:DUF6709 family protein [Clostridium sp. Marseille-QA1073]